MNFLSLSHLFFSSLSLLIFWCLSPDGCRLWINELGWQHEQTEGEWNKVVGEEGNGRMEGDVKTKGSHLYNPLWAVEGPDRNSSSLGAELQSLHEPPENLREKYGRLLWATAVPSGKGEMQEKGSTSSCAKWPLKAFTFIKKKKKKKNIDQHCADFISSNERRASCLLLLWNHRGVDSLQHLFSFYNAISMR